MVLMSTWSVPDPANGILLNYTITCNGSISETFPALMVIVTDLWQGCNPTQCTHARCLFVGTVGGVGDAPILLKKGLPKMVRIIKVMGY